ncbi:MAG: hypothetical protein WD030_00185, partial [Pirellulales bacterium]
EYRQGRPHDAFLTQLETDTATLRQAVVDAWRPEGVLVDWPRELTREMAQGVSRDSQRAAFDAPPGGTSGGEADSIP